MNEVTDRPSLYQEWFNSPFYHQLYAGRKGDAANTFIHKLIQHIHPTAGSHILETGCGLGDRGRMFAAAGFDVTGIDIVPGNIARAKQWETEKLQFFIHDIRLPFWINYFDYAFSLFDGLGHFRTRREHDAAIRTIGSSLRPGAVFVIDYLNLHHAEEQLAYNETEQTGAATFTINRWQDETHFYKKITVSDPSSLSTPLVFTERTARLSLGDFTDMLSFHSLQIQEVFGDYELGEYHVNKAPRLIIIARKKTNEPTGKQKRLYSDGRTTDPLT